MNRLYVRNLVLVAVFALGILSPAMGACLPEKCCCHEECGCLYVTRGSALDFPVVGSCATSLAVLSSQTVLVLTTDKLDAQGTFTSVDEGLGPVQPVVAAEPSDFSSPPPQRRRHLILSTFLL